MTKPLPRCTSCRERPGVHRWCSDAKTLNGLNVDRLGTLLLCQRCNNRHASYIFGSKVGIGARIKAAVLSLFLDVAGQEWSKP
jgi:hypothetical protein